MRNIRAGLLRTTGLAVSASFLLLVTGWAQDKPKTCPLELKEGRLTGAGAEMLRVELPKAQFILWGEDHGMADSPVLLRALAQESQPFGFKYHAAEVGPLSTRLIAETLVRNGIPGLHQMVHETPMAFPFLSLKEDAELASDFLGADEKGMPYLWGVDQEFIGSPGLLLPRLAGLAPNESARAAASKLLAEEKEAGAKGAQEKFLLFRFTESDFPSLADQFKGQAEAEKIVAELQESAAIYQLWMSGRNYENNARRARLLATNFLAAYQVAADPQPKVIFKMGLEHLGWGTTPNNTVDLGSLASSIARTNGKTTLRIAFVPSGGHNLAFAPKPGNPTAVEAYESAEAKELFRALGIEATKLAKDHWTLIPMEPVRQSLDTKGINALKPFTRFVVLGYDYLITTPHAKAATFLY